MSTLIEKLTLEVFCMKSFLKLNLFIAQALVLSLSVFAGSEGDPLPSDARTDALIELHELHQKHLPLQLRVSACSLLFAAMKGSPAAGPTSVEPVIDIAITATSYGAGNKPYIFTKVFHQKAGVGWREPLPNGLIWYDVGPSLVRHDLNEEREPEELTAKEYCESLGLRLPTREELEQLGLYMGATRKDDGQYSFEGFKPQVLPNLNGVYFWSSSDYSSADYAFLFTGSTGKLEGGYRYYKFAVRCVGR